MRLFVSVDLPPSLAQDVEAVQEEFADASGLEFTDPEKAHFTIKFLGEVSERRVPEVTDALDDAVAAADVDPFETTIEGLGVFPSLDYISVLWLGVSQGMEKLSRLHETIERAMVEDVGFEAEDHDFTPHVTLARMQHAGGKELIQKRVQSWNPTVGTMTVEEVRLTESTLTAEGPVYSTVHAAEL